MLVFLLLARPITQHKFPLSRAHGLLRRLLTILKAWYRRRELALRAWFPPARYVFPTIRTRAPSDAPLGRGLSSAMRTRASSAVSLSRGVNSAMGVRAPNAAPIDHGTEACTLRASPQARVAQQYSCGDGASPFCGNVFIPPLPNQAVAVGFRCGTANPQTLFLTTRWRSV